MRCVCLHDPTRGAIIPSDAEAEARRAELRARRGEEERDAEPGRLLREFDELLRKLGEKS